MNFKTIIGIVAISLSSHAMGANYLISNVVTGDDSDWLYQNVDGSALNGGIVTLGYFSGGAPSTSINDIFVTINNFTQQASGITGTFSADLEGSFAGYVQSAPVSGATITAPNTLIGQNMYVFVGNGATLLTSTAWALAVIGPIADDDPNVQDYSSNPIGSAIHGNIGQFSTFTGDVGLGAGTYNTLRLVAIPEPSSMMLAALGVFALLRRRR